MFMRAVFASAMLIGLAGAAQAETKIVYPPYSYQPSMKPCEYIPLGDRGYSCGRGHGYGHAHYGWAHDYDYAKMAKVVVVLPPPAGQ